MAEETELDTVGKSNEVVTDFVLVQIEAARRSAEVCHCHTCRKYYQSWLDWRDLVVSSGGSEVPPYPSFPSSSDLPPDHPGFGPDGPPPPMDSGNLADWYGKGL